MEDTHLPSLEISGPDGQERQMKLTENRLTIGRLEAFNDLALGPDPQQLITRKIHCALERDAGNWWVVDNASFNGTFLQHEEGEMARVNGRAELKDGDRILILGKFSEEGQPIYWKLAFSDPFGTRPAPLSSSSSSYLEYDWLQARLFRIDGRKRKEIPLSAQEHKLVRYMDQRNRLNRAVVLCTNEELLSALWEEQADTYPDAVLTSLVWKVREKLGSKPADQFIETVRGLGYRLKTRSPAL